MQTLSQDKSVLDGASRECMFIETTTIRHRAPSFLSTRSSLLSGKRLARVFAVPSRANRTDAIDRASSVTTYFLFIGIKVEPRLSRLDPIDRRIFATERNP